MREGGGQNYLLYCATIRVNEIEICFVLYSMVTFSFQTKLRFRLSSLESNMPGFKREIIQSVI